MNHSLPLSVSLLLIGVLLISGMLCALLGGSTFNLQLEHVSQALFSDAKNLANQLILTIRLPRVLIAAATGAALAMAGALMQGITRNPLASPALFGINAGAACLLVSAQIGVLPLLSQLPLIVVTALGAALAGALVLMLGGGLSGKLQPTRIVLAGVAVSALLIALTRTLLILDEQAQSVMSWLAGSLADTDWQHWQQLWPWLIVGTALALSLSQKLNLLALGDEMAAGLGLSPVQIRLLASLAVVLLTATTVAVTGPIAFVGLLVPHLARKLIGQDYRVLLPTAALLGAALMCWADLISRLLVFPSETPVGLVTALIGAPCFIWLASQQRETH